MKYYAEDGAPQDQNALIHLLRDVQEHSGGSVPREAVQEIAEYYDIKQSLILAVIKRVATLHLGGEGHCLEICGNPKCSRSRDLYEFAEKTYGKHPQGFTIQRTGCMHACGKGPNIKWDGKQYSLATEDTIRSLVGR